MPRILIGLWDNDMTQYSSTERATKACFGSNDFLNVVYEPIIHFYNTKPHFLIWDSQYPKGAFHLVRTHLGGEGGSSLLYISIAYYMQKGGEGVQRA